MEYNNSAGCSRREKQPRLRWVCPILTGRLSILHFVAKTVYHKKIRLSTYQVVTDLIKIQGGSGVLAENLKKARTKKKISQLELAKSVGLTQQAYSLFELGLKCPSVSTLVLLSKELGVSIDELVK